MTIIEREVQEAVNYLMAEMYNNIQDGTTECLPSSIAEIEQIVLDSVTRNKYRDGCVYYNQAVAAVKYANYYDLRDIIKKTLMDNADYRAIVAEISTPQQPEPEQKEHVPIPAKISWEIKLMNGKRIAQGDWDIADLATVDTMIKKFWEDMNNEPED